MRSSVPFERSTGRSATCGKLPLRPCCVVSSAVPRRGRFSNSSRPAGAASRDRAEAPPLKRRSTENRAVTTANALCAADLQRPFGGLVDVSADLLQQARQTIEIAQFVQKVTCAERRCGATIFSEIVIGQDDGQYLADFATVDDSKHSKTCATVKMQIQQYHINGTPFEHRYCIGFAVDSACQFRSGHDQDRLTQAVGQQPRILNEQ